MILEFSSPDIKYSLEVPQWFMDNRGNGYQTFRVLTTNTGFSPEVETYKKMREYMGQFSKDSVFLDIGANLGIISIPIALMGYKVLAVEPSSINLGYLKKSLDINGLSSRVSIIPYAASYCESTIDLYSPEEGDCASLSQLSAETAGKAVAEKIKSIVMDSWIEENNIENIKFIKIDVQGGEFNVLKGLDKLLSKNEELHVLIEVDNKLLVNFNSSPVEISQFMASKGFNAFSWGYGDVLFIKSKK